LLVDEQATKPNILKAVRRAAEKAQPQDTLLVFLAGHGVMVDQQYYFLPHEFRRQAEMFELDVRQQGLLSADLGDALAAVPALKRMVVFDTGQSGGKAGLARTARDPFAFRGAVERLSRSQGVFTIAAAAVSDRGQEVPALGHGVLTYALLAGLRAAAGGPLKERWIEPSDEDRVARVLEWYGFASTHVPRLSKELFGQPSQEVQLGGAGGTSFPVLPLSASAELPQTATAKPAAAQPQPRPAPAVVGRGTSKLYLIAVGIDRYAQEAMNLKYAASDAQAIAELFRHRGPRHYSAVQAQEILDAQATRTGILQTLEEVARQAQADDLLIVFLAGHGRMVGQRYYFIPHDFRGQADALDEDIRQQGLAADVLGDALSRVSASKRLLIFDTCASGGALGLSRENRDAFAFRGAIEKLGQQQGVFAIAASSAGAEAQEIEDLGHGVLTYALLAGLKAVRSGPLDGLSVQPASPDGMADVLEWLSYASGHVPRLTKSFLGREQEVQVAGQGVSFPVLPTSE